jgi:hypothetical protein
MVGAPKAFSWFSSKCNVESVFSNVIKGEAGPIKHNVLKTWGNGGKAPPFLMWALDEGEWSVLAPGKEPPGSHLIGWLSPKVALDAMEKGKSCVCL